MGCQLFLYHIKRTEIAEYYALETDDALTMNLGINPLLQFGLDETREAICRAILNDIATIQYVPFDSDTIGNPALDLGDVLTFTGGHADSNQMAAITSMEIKIGGQETLKCVGKNPLLAQAKSKNDKNISGLLNQIEQGKIGIHTFTNTSVITLSTTEVKIISIQFASSEENHMQFFAQAVVSVTADPVTKNVTGSADVVIPSVNVNSIPAAEGETAEQIGTTEEQTVTVSIPVSWTEDGQAVAYIVYELNDTRLEIPLPVETWHSGKHILTLYYPIESIIPNYTNTFNVYLRMTGGTGSIAVGDIIASISGQSMAAQEAWDGKINIEDIVEPFVIGGGISPRAFTETIEKDIKWVVNYYWSDTLPGRQTVGAFGAFIETGGTA